jgi:phenylpropionate dioxygenase-like ring-hydroxylating dioxygenase large terminal subunit
MGIDFRMFWYVVAESWELKSEIPLARKVLGEHLVVFRDIHKKAVALQDRCLHRQAPLSAGRVVAGCLECPYHGWVYTAEGRVQDIPSMGPSWEKKLGPIYVKTFPVREQDGYVYVRLEESPSEEFTPFSMLHQQEPGWRHIRLRNIFPNNVTRCCENFVDIPHTAYVHKGIFRSRKNQRLTARIECFNGSVHVDYQNETANLGIFSWFLNPRKKNLSHSDSFFMPNITCVKYDLGSHWNFVITSQSVPATDEETWVYTDLTYYFGPWTGLAAPFVKRMGKKVIDQDVQILSQQMDGIRRYGETFFNTPADLIHVFIESIRRDIALGQDPRRLPSRCEEIEFWV